MLAVYKRELRSYFYTMTGYVFMAFLFVVVGVYFVAFNLSYGYPLFEYALSSSVFVMLIATPVLSMKVLADERRQKVDQLLLTSPVMLYKIVLGKYLAMITVLALPTTVFCLYPVILSGYGEISWAQTYVSILGFYLIGCVCLAIGLFISSLTDNPVIAAVVTFGAVFVCYLMGGIASLIPDTASASFLTLTLLWIFICGFIWKLSGESMVSGLIGILGEAAFVVLYVTRQEMFEGLIQTILNVFNITERFSDLTGGILDMTAILYFLSMIAAGIFLTIQSIQKRRWS